MKIKYKYAVYKDDMLYDYFDTMKQAESFFKQSTSKRTYLLLVY